MSTLVTIQGTDLPTNSRADINGNFAALNSEKIETSVLDTDTTLAANSDSKVATQKAVKAYVDAGGNVNASETVKGIVEIATSAEVATGTTTGGSGATLVVTPSTLLSVLAGSIGDGSDGDVTISAPTTLTRNMYYNNLTINDTLTTAGYQIFVKETVSGTGTIDWGIANNGAAGATGTGPNAGGAGGAQSGSGPLKNVAGTTGADGSSTGGNVAGLSGSTQEPALGTDGNQGGAGGIGENGAGGAGGTVGAAQINRKFGIISSEVLMMLSPDTNGLLVVPKPQGQATGGGEGGPDSSYAGTGASGGGGGAGASGGIVFIAASIFAGTFTIKATGGNGGNGGASYRDVSANIGGPGGGAGGNGGIAVVIYSTKSWTGSYNVAGGTGGTGGTGAGTGTNGSTGANGDTGVIHEYSITSLL